MIVVDPQPLAPVVFVTGKGGVGKTSIAAGLAVAAVAQGREAIFVEFADGAAGDRALGADRRAVKRVVIEPKKAVLDAAKPLFGSSLLARLALDNFAMKPFIGAAPAVRELAMLALVQQTAERHPRARVVVDMPATGHSVAWLRVPAQGRDLIRYGPLYDLCARLARDLVAPGKASVAVVSLAERMVLRETLELCQRLSEEVGLPAQRLFVNRVPRRLPEGAVAAAADLAAHATDPSVRSAAEPLVERLAQRDAVSHELDRTLEDILGTAASMATLLPRAAKDPTAAEVATWLQERGAA
ncbi:MAG: ArsA-related P-loop ATPase [Myxococcota bacterium]